MNKLLVLSLFLFTASCGPVAAGAAPGDVPTSQRTPTSQPTATTTVTPSPTIGYEATAYAAQQTADAALRLLVDATRAHEAEQFEYARMTEQADLATLQAAVWTATAAPSAIPASQTAAAIHNTIALGEQTKVASQITATAEAPEIKRKYAQAEADAKFAGFKIITFGLVGTFFAIGFAVFMLNVGLKIQHERDGIAYWMKYGPPTAADNARQLEPKAGAFHIDERDGKYASQTRLTVPPHIATSEQVKIIGELLRAGKSFARDNFIGGAVPGFGKRNYEDLVDWLLENNCAIRSHPTDERAGITLNERGELVFGLRES